ncbi:MAG: AMMECR1 domain-containing protein [Spirochaetes bacterium]|nr:MAG: AMMECR1 domain-containing protein [Spirochaetota bacterium]
MTTPRDRETLIAIARSAIEAELDGQKLEITEYPEGSGGVFVTLKSEGRLRGCIGHLQSEDPIYKTVAKMARSAAFSDPRFPPLTRNEFDSISIEISRLSEFFPIAAENVVVGTHGLLLSMGYHSGLLLPQVPGEQGWDRTAFLSGLCRKSGLPEGSWENTEAVLEAFTAEVFGEK